MLPKFSHISPPESPVSPRLALRVRNEMSQVRFDIILHSGSCPLELVEALEFISNKLIVGRVLQREEIPQKGNNFCGPGSHVISAADTWLKPRLIFKPSCSKLIESGSTDLQVGAGRGGINGSGVKISQGFSNKFDGQTVGDLFFSSQQPWLVPWQVPRSLPGALPPDPRSFPLWVNGPQQE
jgi:hypothetical protein